MAAASPESVIGDGVPQAGERFTWFTTFTGGPSDRRRSKPDLVAETSPHQVGA